MTEGAADRRALMIAIKRELRQRLWDDPEVGQAYGVYESLFVTNPEPMWVYDATSLRVLDVNEAAVQRYGYTRDEFLELTIKDLRPETDIPKFLELTQRLPSSDRTGPWRHRLKSGEVIQVLITSHALSYRARPARIVMAEKLTPETDID